MTVVTSVIQRMSTPSIVNARVQLAERADDLAARAEREQVDRLEQEADGERRDEHRRGRRALRRSGRNAMRSCASASATTAATHMRIASGAGQPLVYASTYAPAVISSP